jgi:two-component system sensor histidine kinase AlgZ
MHPILQDKWRLLAYLAAWVPIGGLLAALMSPVSGPAEAVLLALPLAGLFGFISLAAWYPCRALPLAGTGVARLLGTHAVAGALSTMIWLFIGAGLAVGLERVAGFAGAATRYSQQTLLLFPIGMLLFALAVSVHYLLAAFEASRESEKRALELSVLARDSELKALRSQISPHFLFNSLNSISSLAGSDPDKARRMCVALSRMLRRSLGLGAVDTIALSEEMSLAEDYLAVEKVRFGDRLGVERQIGGDVGELRVPPLLLQPLIENAITHGIAHLLDGGIVQIEAGRQNDLLHITITNPCDPDRSVANGEGLGLENVRRRLHAIHGSGANVQVGREPDRFRVTLTFPAK